MQLALLCANLLHILSVCDVTSVMHGLCREVNDNQLSSVLDESSPMFTGLMSLSRLVLTANHIKSVSRHAFEGLDKLRHLDLTGNDVASLQDNTLTRLTHLHTVLVSVPVFLFLSVCIVVSVCLYVPFNMCISSHLCHKMSNTVNTGFCM